MARVVLDANVLASGFTSHAPSTPPVRALDGWRARLFTLVVSDHIIAEVARTFAKPYFASRITAEDAAADLLLLRREAELVTITAHVSAVGRIISSPATNGF